MKNNMIAIQTKDMRQIGNDMKKYKMNSILSISDTEYALRTLKSREKVFGLHLLFTSAKVTCPRKTSLRLVRATKLHNT